MDLNLIAAAHHLPGNQPRFDPEASDEAILSAISRRESLRAVWSHCAARWGTIGKVSSYFAAMAMRRQPS